MTSWCKEILSSINDDSSWKASILIPSSIWHERDVCGNDINMDLSTNQNNTITSGIEDNEVDIIQLYTDSERVKSKLFRTALTHNYPKTALFHFESYDSFNERDNVVEFIKKKLVTKELILLSSQQRKHMDLKKTMKSPSLVNIMGHPKNLQPKNFTSTQIHHKHLILL